MRSLTGFFNAISPLKEKTSVTKSKILTLVFAGIK